MFRRGEILTRHRAAIRAAVARHNASSIALVGSVARGTDGPDNDCDFLCEWAPGASLLNVAGLEREELLGCKVEVSSARAVEPPCASMFDDAIAL